MIQCGFSAAHRTPLLSPSSSPPCRADSSSFSTILITFLSLPPQIFSSGKNLYAICLSMCVSRGLLGYNLPVAHYWPSFAQAGKGNITVADVLRHDSGLFRLTPLSGKGRGVSFEDVQSGGERLSRLIEQASASYFMSEFTERPPVSARGPVCAEDDGGVGPAVF
jgi:hypothetical protein